jgi:hypothetical protein
MPEDLAKAALGEELVVFAGAGISTESPRVFPDSFAQVIAAEARVDLAVLSLSSRDSCRYSCPRIEERRICVATFGPRGRKVDS